MIEEDEIVRDKSDALLERFGYHVPGAETGKEGIRLAGTFAGRIDLVILNAIVPDINEKAVYPLFNEACPKLKEKVSSSRYCLDGPAQEMIDASARFSRKAVPKRNTLRKTKGSLRD